MEACVTYSKSEPGGLARGFWMHPTPGEFFRRTRSVARLVRAILPPRRVGQVLSLTFASSWFTLTAASAEAGRTGDLAGKYRGDKLSVEIVAEGDTQYKGTIHLG